MPDSIAVPPWRTVADGYHILFESLDAGVGIGELICDAQGQVTDLVYREVNAAFAQQSGLHDAVGKPLRALLPPLAPHWFDLLTHVRAMGEPVRVDYSVGNSQQWYRARFSRIDGPDSHFIVAVCEDITAQKTAEVALRVSEERLAAFVRATSDIVYEMSADWHQMHTLQGKAFIATTDHPRDDWMDAYIPDDEQARVWTVINQAIATQSPFELEHRVTRIDGTIGWTFSRAIPLLNDAGDIVTWFGTASDITERRHADERLRQNDARQSFLLHLNDVLRPLTDPVMIQREASRILRAQLGADRVAYAELDADEDTAYPLAEDRADYLAPLIGRTYAWSDFDPIGHAQARQGRSISRTDIQAADDLTPTQKAACAAVGFRALINVPLVKSGRLIAFIAVHCVQPRAWLPTDIILAEEMADRTWAAVERAAAQAAVQRANTVLEQRVDERTAELAQTNATLSHEIAERTQLETERVALLQRLITAQEDERQHLARELHDNVGQFLSALLIRLSVLEAAVEPSADLQHRLADVRQVARQVDNALDLLTLELRPLILNDLGLEDALHAHVQQWTTTSGVPVEIVAHGMADARLAPQVETTIYRIVQEALNNTLKYAQATAVSLILERRRTQLQVVVEDNGVGFDPAAVRRERRGGRQLGLIGMSERATLVGGTLTIDAEPGTGTTIYLRIPLAEEPY